MNARNVEYDDAGRPARISVADKRKRAEAQAQKLIGKGELLEPAVGKGVKIASTFWGQAWNRNVESFQYYEHRLTRGRSGLKHGAVIDLKIKQEEVTALVSGDELYEVRIVMKPLEEERWEALKKACSGRISSLISLLQGKLPETVMSIVTSQGTGLFPEPRDIRFDCSCLDDADFCEHAAAAAYGVGARLDERPELLFVLRGVDHMELIEGASAAVLEQSEASPAGDDLGDLSDIFGIEWDGGAAPTPEP